MIENLQEFVDKMDSIKKINPLDLSTDQDLTIAIMNLISIEEHLFFSGAKTSDNSFYDLINTVREDRKELMQKIIKSYTGEVWCISKHLLAGCMRLFEVGTKTLSQGQKEEAYNFFSKAYNLYCLFWGLNMNLISNSDTKEEIKKIDKKTSDRIEEGAICTEIKEEQKNTSNETIVSKVKNFVSKSVDCCKE